MDAIDAEEGGDHEVGVEGVDGLHADDADVQLLVAEPLEGLHGGVGGGLELEGGTALAAGGAGEDGVVPLEVDGDGHAAVLLLPLDLDEADAAAGPAVGGEGEVDHQIGRVVAHGGEAVADGELDGRVLVGRIPDDPDFGGSGVHRHVEHAVELQEALFYGVAGIGIEVRRHGLLRLRVNGRRGRKGDNARKR